MCAVVRGKHEAGPRVDCCDLMVSALGGGRARALCVRGRNPAALGRGAERNARRRAAPRGTAAAGAARQRWGLPRRPPAGRSPIAARRPRPAACAAPRAARRARAAPSAATPRGRRRARARARERRAAGGGGAGWGAAGLLLALELPVAAPLLLTPTAPPPLQVPFDARGHPQRAPLMGPHHSWLSGWRQSGGSGFGGASGGARGGVGVGRAEGAWGGLVGRRRGGANPFVLCSEWLAYGRPEERWFTTPSDL